MILLLRSGDRIYFKGLGEDDDATGSLEGVLLSVIRYDGNFKVSFRCADVVEVLDPKPKQGQVLFGKMY